MGRINIDIPDDLHSRLRMLAAAEGKGFYEWLKDDLTQTCPDEQTLLEMLRDIRKDRENTEPHQDLHASKCASKRQTEGDDVRLASL